MGISSSATLAYGIDIEDFDADHALYEEHDVEGCELMDLVYAMGLDVEVGFYGPFDNHSSILCTRKVRGYEYSPSEPDIDELTEGSYDDDHARLKAACEQLGIDFEDKKPGWLLCSSVL